MPAFNWDVEPEHRNTTRAVATSGTAAYIAQGCDECQAESGVADTRARGRLPQGRSPAWAPCNSSMSLRAAGFRARFRFTMTPKGRQKVERVKCSCASAPD